MEKHEVHEGHEVIVMGPEDAGIVFKNDGSMDIYMPEFKPDDDKEATAALLATAVTKLVADGHQVLFDTIDEVGKECDRLQAEEAKDDTIPGKD